MKRLLVSTLALPLLLSACGEPSICTLNDSDCDGVPDDLGRAIDKDGYPGPDQLSLEGEFVGWMVDLNCDNSWDISVDAVGLDTNGDDYIDAIDINPDGERVTVTTGSASAVYGDCSGGGGGVTPGDGDGVTPGDGDGVVTPGDGDGDAVTPGDGDGDAVVNPWDMVPDVEVGDWNAPISDGAKTNLSIEFTRWKNNFLKDCGGGKLSVPMQSGRTVSEGMGYGMLIMASMGTQAEFDAMYATYRDAPKTAGGLMRWDCNECVTSCSADQAASDGDLDAAMALLQAEVRFGGGTYVAAAKDLIGLLRGAVMKNCGGKVHLVPGEWDPGCENLNPSYFSPGYYRAFARVDTLGASVWNQSIDSAYEIFDQYKSGGPNGMWPDGIGGTNFSGNGYDACRVPWRVAIDYAWTADTRASSLLSYVSGKVDSSGFSGLSTDPNSAFYGALALSGFVGGQAKTDSYYSTWMGSNPLYDNAYYQGTLRMIYLMLMAGQFPSTLPSTM